MTLYQRWRVFIIDTVPNLFQTQANEHFFVCPFAHVAATFPFTLTTMHNSLTVHNSLTCMEW